GTGLFHIALADQTVDFIGCVGGRDVHELGELVDRRGSQCADGLRCKDFRRGQTGLLVLKPREQLMVKAEGEFPVCCLDNLFQHSAPPRGFVPRGYARCQVHAGPFTRAKVSSAVAATWPSTMAFASPMPTGPFILVRVHSISSTSPGTT